MQRSEELPTSEVIRLLRVKVARNPSDFDSSLMLGSNLYQTGDLKGSASVFRLLLKQQPEHFQALLLLARTLARSGESFEALKVFARAQRVNPGNTQAWQVAAALAADTRDWLELLEIARGWTGAHPSSTEAWQALSRAYFEESRFEEAIAAFEPVLTLDPKSASHLISLARMEIAAQQYEVAHEHLNAAKEISPDSPELMYSLSRLYYLTGKLNLAEDYCLRTIAARPRFAPAHVVLGDLREGRLDNNEIQAVKTLFENNATPAEYRVMLGFTLGDALDRSRHYDQAFNAWDEANTINRKISEREGFVYQPKQTEQDLALLIELFNEPIELNLNRSGKKRPRPIFVVGMPRTGTTLIESILASHSLVEGAGELPTLYDIHEGLMGLARLRGVDAAREELRAQASAWRDRYLEAMPTNSGAASIVDKQPLNFRSIGLIRLLFPKSPIIYTKRAPIDVGLSIYRHKFSKSWPCAHRLYDIGHYYGVHARTIDFWQQTYRESIYVVDYASLVKNTEAEISSLLRFVGLDFEQACLEPHKTKRSVATFSAVQVKQPVSANYGHRAAPYARQLVALHDALVRAGIK
ncbi:MAG: tetratricopeptide (TPR) repeat protein [Pseudohongiellaceae bacterium]|jgi:tetratricopeptide (TPR) repeat protein